MTRTWIAAAALAALLATPAARAQPAPATVEGVQMPAWVERDGARQPLAPGMALRPGDSLSTGPNARLLLRLAEGSAVKLGENGTLRLDALAARMREPQGAFSAALNVIQGAFRFTTDAAQRLRRRDVSIRVATVTAGVRGTDLWGKAAADRDIVCLIEGDIEVQRGGDAAFRMRDPLSFFIAPRGQPALPVRPVEPAQLQQWAAETEIEAGRGAARRGGRWKVVLAASESENAVIAVYQAMREAGYAAELNPVRRDGRRAYEARIASLPSREEAQALANALDGRFGVSGPRVVQ
jgi:hypothetical protein